LLIASEGFQTSLQLEDPGVVAIGVAVIAGAGYLAAGEDALPDRLVHVALEEVAHFVTNGATDNSRDFQNFLLDLAVKIGRQRIGVK
jgi:hypothetical protein